MIRLFDTHHIREIYELDGIWDFEASGKRYRLAVPGCWEEHPELVNYRGAGTYTRKIHIKRTGNIRLEFKGVSHTAEVYFDGEKIADHYNAYTPFSAVIANVSAGAHEIRVGADNSFSGNSALHIPNDYYTYGGITRPAALEYLGDIYVERIRFTPRLNNGVWSAKTEVIIKNISASAKKASLKISLAGTVSERETEIPPMSEAAVEFERDFDGVKPWSAGEPSLYELKAELFSDGEAVDDLIERVGFRVVEVRDTKIYLNGKPVFMKGFNRHEDCAGDGCAIGLQQMTRDMNLMLDANANAVRTCHYPNDERFLDLCDERGIMVWEENHARGLGLKEMLNPNFERQCGDCIHEMIENHYNHPSIVIWGILNECASETAEGREMYKKQYDQIRAMDKTRPVTSATCRHFTDICLDLPDVVSFNMYSNWYADCDIARRNDEEIDWIYRSGGENKPIIVSEVGAAAIYGCRDRSRCKWSEERQSDILRENLEVYLNDKRISGVFVWQFADCRVTEEGEWFQSRARCHNNKGVVDEYRRPKMAYDTVMEMFEKYGKS